MATVLNSAGRGPGTFGGVTRHHCEHARLVHTAIWSKAMEDGLLDRRWLLHRLDGDVLGETDARAQITLQLANGEDGGVQVAGRSGCNRYFGQARIVGGKITFGALGLTRMACPPPQMALERQYLERLAAVTSWALEDDALLLAGGGESLTFRPVEPDL